MKKILVAAVSLAALLFASCSNPVTVANDRLDAPNVKAVATDNGVVVLTWDAVKDASSYTVYEKAPGTDTYQEVYIPAQGTNGFIYKVIPVYKKDAEYSYKVVANAGREALISSEKEVSVKTPEEWKDYAIDASRIKVELVQNTLNSYDISLPADAGYKYSIKLVAATGLDAKALYESTSYITAVNVTSSDVNGASKVAAKETITVKNEDGEDEEKEVDEAVWFGQYTITAGTSNGYANTGLDTYYAVVKATPVNGAVGKTVYAVSSAAAKYDPSAIAVTFRNESLTQIGKAKVRFSFTASKTRDGKDVDVSKFKVYRHLTENTAAEGETPILSTGAIEEVKGLTTSTTIANDDGKNIVYYVDSETKEYDGLKGYMYCYFAIAETEAGQVYSSPRNLSIDGNNAWKRTLSTPVVSIHQTTDNKVKVQVSNVARGAKLEVKYFDYDSAKAAQTSVDGELSKTITVKVDAGQEAQTSGSVTTTTVDGVKTNENDTRWDNITYSSDEIELLPAVIRTTSNNVNSGITSTVTDTNNNGKYYVVKAFVTMDGCDPVESQAVTYKLQKNVTINQGGTPITTWSVIY